MSSQENDGDSTPQGDRGDCELESENVVDEVPQQEPLVELPEPEEPSACEDAVEVFCGRVPKDMPEQELSDMFAAFGPLLEFRLVKDPWTSYNRGYAFLTYQRKEDALKAIAKLNGTQVRHRQYLKVTRALPNSRLFVANIPKVKSREELLEEFGARTVGLRDVIIYSSPDDRRRNRGFCFLDFDSHKEAATAKRRLSVPRLKVYGCDIVVDWADPEQEVDEEIMSKVRIIFAKNLSALVSEDDLREVFSPFGMLEKVKKMKDFAFVHFSLREDAAKAKESLDGTLMHGIPMKLFWAKPPTDKTTKQEILRAREKRILHQQSLTPVQGSVNPYPMNRIYENLGGFSGRDRGDNVRSDGRVFVGPLPEFGPGFIPCMRPPPPMAARFPVGSFFAEPPGLDDGYDGYVGRHTMVWLNTETQRNRYAGLGQGSNPSRADADNNWRANAHPPSPRCQDWRNQGPGPQRFWADQEPNWRFQN